MFALQAIINIAVVSGVMPTKGIPLPFVSSGGSSLLFSMMGAGILINIARHREAEKHERVSTGEESAKEDTENRLLLARIWYKVTTKIANFSW